MNQRERRARNFVGRARAQLTDQQNHASFGQHARQAPSKRSRFFIRIGLKPKGGLHSLPVAKNPADLLPSPLVRPNAQPPVPRTCHAARPPPPPPAASL